MVAHGFEFRIWDLGNDDGNRIGLASTKTYLVYFEARMGYSEPQTIRVPSELAGEKWVHIAVRFKDVKVSIYIDGLMNATGPCTVIPHNLGITAGNWIGRSHWSGVAYFSGSIADFRLYERGLADEEIYQISQGNTLN